MLHRWISVYETPAWYYIVGSDISESEYSVLKIDRAAPMQQLTVVDAGQKYSRDEVNQLLSMLQGAHGLHASASVTIMRSSYSAQLREARSGDRRC